MGGEGKKEKVKGDRAPNFSAGDSKMLLALFKKWSHRIECKKTDAQSNKEKNQSWTKLTQEFNAVASVPRTEAQLRTR